MKYFGSTSAIRLLIVTSNHSARVSSSTDDGNHKMRQSLLFSWTADLAEISIFFSANASISLSMIKRYDPFKVNPSSSNQLSGAVVNSTSFSFDTKKHNFNYFNNFQ